jgi:hypothetical protein
LLENLVAMLETQVLKKAAEDGHQDGVAFGRLERRLSLVAVEPGVEIFVAVDPGRA